MDVKLTSEQILRAVGGEENVALLTHCATRLRFQLKEPSKADLEALRAIDGVIGVVDGKAQLQVIIGKEVAVVCDAICGMCPQLAKAEDAPKAKNGNVFSRALAVIPQVFTPILPALTGCGMIKAIFLILQVLKVVDTSSQTYIILNYVSDVCFYFLPFMLAHSAAKVFKTNGFMAIALAGILMHPTFTGLVAAGESVSLFGLPVALVSYSSSLLPIILGVWIMSWLERLLKKYIPESLQFLCVPTLILLIMTPVLLVVVGPLGYYLGVLLSKLLLALNDVLGWLAVAIISVVKPLLVMTGMHYALSTAFIQMFTSTGFDTFYMSSTLLSNLAQAGAAFGVFLKTKNKKLKPVASSTAFTAFMGITEPAMYGVTLKYKRPMICAMVGAAAGGLYAGIMKIRFVALTGTGITAVFGVSPEYMVHILIAVVITLAVSAVTTYIWGFNDAMCQE